ncbi:MAG: hypothetical protein RIS36_799 [Pseudomonadota bacterium]
MGSSVGVVAEARPESSAPATVESQLASLKTPHPLTPQQEVIKVGLEAVRYVGLMIEQVKSSRHETLRAIAEDEGLRASIARESLSVMTFRLFKGFSTTLTWGAGASIKDCQER